MKAILLEATEDNPQVIFDTSRESFEIKGKSLPEDSLEFYQPLFNWITEYSKSPKEISNFVFHFEFISTSSTKQVHRLLELIDQLAKTKQVNVTWLWDMGDINMRKTGELLQQTLALKMTIKDV